ncbi:hypothetical protein EJ03DRAFT_376131 [Teratosphaeria nubilosa]|uniref:Uncharacterized protein n=1 Tax=Teratosphaeria nubilosa TaxID=161662 RepID=A0A6G1L3B9_9PEZI|nr:hypothetical protein EJ03DRAFT_376131 [Teratosphaeria nubilosa]
MSRERNRRPLYATPPSRSHGHSVLGYWVPLVVAGTLAIGGLAAWIWAERSEHDEDDYPDQKPPQPYPGPPPGQGGYGGGAPPCEGPLPSQSGGPQGQPPPGPIGGEAASYYPGALSTERHEEHDNQQSTFYGQVRGALRRTPSPQQFFDNASKHVSAGIAAAGSALGRIVEDPENGRQEGYGYDYERQAQEGFSDHERWSEEAEEKEKVRRVGMVENESERRAEAARSSREDKGKGRAKRTVAVVVSADTNMDGRMDEEDVVYSEHASILSHLPEYHDPTRTDLFVLIHAPGLKKLPPLSYRPQVDAELASNLGSSYAAINTPGSELQSISPKIDPTLPQNREDDFPSPGRQFDALYQQALSLVSHSSQILCFTTVEGYVHILRHLAPSLTYVSDLLAGREGETLVQLKGWVGHTILVVGDDGTGGLADTETEEETEGEGGRRKEKWWERSSFVGLGKDVEIVDAARVGEDWSKRVGGRD